MINIKKNKFIYFKNKKLEVVDYSFNRQKLEIILNKNTNINNLISEVLVEKKGKDYICIDCYPQCKILHLKRLFLENIKFTLYFLNNNTHLIIFDKVQDQKFFVF